MRGVGVGVEDASLVEDVADWIVAVALTGLGGNAANQAAEGATR
jgi:hypothetical protein